MLDSSACSTTGGGGASALGSPFESPPAQVIDLHAPVVRLGIQEIEQRRGPVFVGKGNGVTNARGHLQVPLLVRLEENQVALHTGVRGIHVAIDLRACGLCEFVAAVDVQPGAQFFALIAIEDAQRNADTGADGLISVGVAEGRVVNLPSIVCLPRRLSNRKAIAGGGEKQQPGEPGGPTPLSNSRRGSSGVSSGACLLRVR